MKKRILMLTLVLMIVLSSFSIVFGSIVPKETNYIYVFPGAEFFIESIDTIDYYKVFDNNGNYLNNIGSFSSRANIQIKNVSSNNFEVWINFSPSDPSRPYEKLVGGTVNPQSLPYVIIKNDLPFKSYQNRDLGTPVIDEFGDQNSPDYMNPIKSISIKPAQRILFNYSPENKDLFLKSITATPKKSITLHQGYYINNEVIDLVIKKDTTDLLIGQNSLDLSDFPPHRPLNQNEYLGYTQANSGNWIWYPGSNGDPVSTDKNSLVTFVIDQRYCSYKVTSANTGLVIDEGGQMPAIPDDGIYSGPGNITDNYLLDRGDFEEGLIGDIKFGFENLFQFIRMPFELLYKFILTLGDVITYALGTVAGFTTALQGIYAILPGPIWFLVIMAISINVFKLIFGR